MSGLRYFVIWLGRVVLTSACVTLFAGASYGQSETRGLPIGVEVKAVVPWPQSLGDHRDDKAPRMWVEVRELMNGGLLHQAGA